MHYSKAHQHFASDLQKPEALINPQDFLGPNYETVLNFWWFIDNPTQKQWKEVNRRYYAPDHAAKVAASNAAYFAAERAASYAARWITSVAYHGNAVTYATWELIGMHTLLNDGKNLLFVPLFDFTKEQTKEQTKEEPPLRPQITFISTPNPNGISASEWIQQYINSPITNNYYQYFGSTYYE